MKKKILVTGGAGFIGSHIVDAYIAQGHDVVVIDNLSTGFKANLNPAAIFYDTDIRDFDEIKKILAHEKPNIINHHAAQAVVTAAGIPLETYTTNATGTLNLLANSKGIERFIFASTGGAMYGDVKDHPFTEEDAPQPNTSSLYGLSKLLAEQSIPTYARDYNFTYVIFRYANVFGPRQNPHGEAGVVAIFCRLLKEGKKPTVYNKDATRDYVFVGDIVRANVLALEKGDNTVINIGGGKEISNQEMFETVAREYGYSGSAEYKPARPGEVFRSALNATKAKKILGWEPSVTLAEGVKKIHQTQQ